MDMQSSLRWAARESSDSASVASEAESSRPLGPRWDDYSFREGDLFYAAAPPPQAAGARPPLPASASSSRVRKRPSSWSLLS
ncbi:Uncharacterized protein HZ326_31764 [Fusarium oxysporum f. sp. albedinis]|nr:Uncharacterized protein HZ326_31764 [Fusarium oxysporum f. sp. albedinis]KAK2471381.1 hypothetical protein H9L39_17612 [Fusarium oxysporum f. sp. albedinis]